MRRLAMLSAMCAFALIAVCAAAHATQDPEKAPKVSAASLAELAEGNAEFALDLYRHVQASAGNLFLSPYSISSALAMTYAGARGNTAEQMAKVLNFSLKGEDLHQAFASLTNDLNEHGNSEGIDLSVANALWGQKNYEFAEEFVDLNKRFYRGGLNTVDFAADTEGARKTINSWVEEQTQDKIKELIERGVLDQSTVLALTNAVYFKGGWASRFDEEMTKPEPFWVTPDSSVTVDMMRQAIRVKYLETQGLQVVELPYRGDELSMIIFFPKEVAGLPSLERILTAKTLKIWLEQLATEDVMVCLPRFSASSDFLLNEPLRAMGMTDAFALGKADFSGMTGGKELFIGAVIHQAVVDVSEEGTEAAAGSAVIMKKGPPIPEFRANHPFLFLIRDNISGSILFICRLVDPTT